MHYMTIAKEVKNDSFKLASTEGAVRNDALKEIASSLQRNRHQIFAANTVDLENGEKEGLAAPLLNRLKFDEHKLSDCIKGIKDLVSMPDPLFDTLMKKKLDDDLVLAKITCPIGVIGVIFESRPDALVQISSLCVKSGNCAILKGGSEAKNTNRALFDVIHAAGTKAGLPSGFAVLIEDRAGIDELLKCHDSIDLIIPRGSNSFVQHIMSNSRIPVMGHADGVCHIYVDRDADIQKAIPVIIDSKIQYTAACNAVETLLIHKDMAGMIIPALNDKAQGKIIFRGDEKAVSCSGGQWENASEEDWGKEYLDNILSVKTVDDIREAVSHINHYGSHHTDAIITENEDAAEFFMTNVDSAGVYKNCSTRFADGFRYGFGAEVGISTGKLHARGPVGIDGLITYKYRLMGDGNIVADYATGKSNFKFISIASNLFQ